MYTSPAVAAASSNYGASGWAATLYLSSVAQSQVARAARVLTTVLTERRSDVQTVLALWRKPAAAMVPGSGWAAILSHQSVTRSKSALLSAC